MGGYAGAALLGVCGMLLAPRLATDAELCVALVVALGCACVRIGRWFIVLILAVVVATLEARSRLDAWLPPTIENTKLSITGVVDSVPQRRADAVRFDVAVEPQAGMQLPRRIELSWYDCADPPHATERWALDVRLRRPRGFANPGGADLAARLLREDLGATGYVRAGRRLHPSPGHGWDAPILRLRERLAQLIAERLGERPATGVIVGLAVGLQDALSPEQWRQLSRSGTSHLMAISGLHIGMVGALFAWLAAAAQRYRQRRGARGCTRDVAAIAGAVAAALYAALAGASVPTQRTMIMIAVAAIVLHRRRHAGGLRIFSAALLAILAVDPLAPLASGFWLSFGAVLALIAGLSGYVVRPSTLSLFLRTQAVATIGLVPILVAAFGSVSLVSVPVNLVAIPLYTLVIVPLVLLGTAAAVVSSAAGALVLTPTAWLIEATWPLFAAPAASGAAAWTVAALPPLLWLLLATGAIGVLAPLRTHARCAAFALLVCVCLWHPQRPPAGQARVTVLDVGQGLAVAIETRHHVLLYDTGPSFRSGSDTGQLVVLPFLGAHGWHHIDHLVISHDDSDHAGGVGSLLQALPIHAISASGRQHYGRVTATHCERGGYWAWEGVEFEWLNGPRSAGAGDNDGSCVLLVSAGGRRLLLPGDIEQNGERELLEHLPRVDIVVVPHHGSRSSSSEPFVATTRPGWALVSAGHRNRWGFPRPEIVDRWQAAGATVLTTAEGGALEFRLGADLDVSPQPWRRRHRRFWLAE
jgi:competence protein ComEC